MSEKAWNLKMCQLDNKEPLPSGPVNTPLPADKQKDNSPKKKRKYVRRYTTALAKAGWVPIKLGQNYDHTVNGEPLENCKVYCKCGQKFRSEAGWYCNKKGEGAQKARDTVGNGRMMLFELFAGNFQKCDYLCYFCAKKFK